MPDLAKSWEVLDGGKTYVFHLEEGVKFHDGTDFDAEAAKWNIDRILDPEVKSWVRPYYEEIEQVEVVDKYTLRIRMKEPSGALLTALGGYFQGIPMTSRKAFETYGKDWLRHPVGTGPYIFKEWIPGKHVILEKNPNYFKKGLPYHRHARVPYHEGPPDGQHGAAGGGDRLHYRGCRCSKCPCSKRARASQWSPGQKWPPPSAY